MTSPTQTPSFFSALRDFLEEIEAPLATPLDDFNNNFDYPENEYKPPFPFADLLEKEVEEEI